MVRIQRRRRTSKITLGSKWLLALLFFLGLTGTFTYTSSRDNMASSTTNSPTIFVAAISATRMLKSGKPYLLYGTAWKKERTAALVEQAITSGFRFIDTACQPRHYNEPGVGEGIVNGMKKLGLQRSDLFIQTKYTPFGGQDPNNIPYDPNAELEDQVEQSIAVSLRNLRTEYIDSLVLHSPLATHGQTMRVWRALEKKVEDGIIGQLGISNCYDLNEFKRIYEEAKVKPSVLQNRFYSDSGFDIGLRSFCDDHSILYQSFWVSIIMILMMRKMKISIFLQVAKIMGFVRISFVSMLTSYALAYFSIF